MTISPGLRQFFLFVAVSGASAVVNIISRIAINELVSYEVAVIIAYMIGMTIAFCLNKIFVFASTEDRMAIEYMRFGMVNLLAITQVWCVSVGLARFVFPAIDFSWHPNTVAHVLGVASPVYTSFLGHKYFSFGGR